MKKENKYTVADLKAMQAWSLQRKIQVTQTRIIEWYQKNAGKVYVSFSGGKDSTVLLDLARRIYPDIPAVFIDTGLEYPELREFVKTIPNVTWLKPEMNFRKVIETYGYPLISKEVSQKIYTDYTEARVTYKRIDVIPSSNYFPVSIMDKNNQKISLDYLNTIYDQIIIEIDYIYEQL